MNEISPWIPLVIGVVVGFAFGAIVTYLVTGNKEEASNTPPQEKLPEGIARKLHVEIVRLWRERAGSKLLVEVDGKIIPDANSLPQNQRQGLENAIREWALWLGLGKSVKTETQPQAPASTQAVPAPAVIVTPQPTEVARPVPPGVPPPPPLPVAADARPKSMVEEIDDLVQEMLPLSALAGHTLRVRSDVKEGVVVWFDNQRFFGIGEVSDQPARELLQAAVAEWEKRKARERGWN